MTNNEISQLRNKYRDQGIGIANEHLQKYLRKGGSANTYAKTLLALLVAYYEELRGQAKTKAEKEAVSFCVPDTTKATVFLALYNNPEPDPVYAQLKQLMQSAQKCLDEHPETPVEHEGLSAAIHCFTQPNPELQAFVEKQIEPYYSYMGDDNNCRNILHLLMLFLHDPQNDTHAVFAGNPTPSIASYVYIVFLHIAHFHYIPGECGGWQLVYKDEETLKQVLENLEEFLARLDEKLKTA